MPGRTAVTTLGAMFAVRGSELFVKIIWKIAGWLVGRPAEKYSISVDD